MLSLRRIFVAAPLLFGPLMACSTAQFSGATPAPANAQNGAAPTDAPNAAPAGTPPLSSVTAPSSPGAGAQPPPVVMPSSSPLCPVSKQVTGARVAFLVDNSGSNSVTDCPAARAAGTSNGTDVLATCGAQTARESAVLASYDLLAQVAASQVGNPLATSQLAIASFPSLADEWRGFQAQTSGFLPIDASHRASVAAAMQFSRAPRGLTPYAAALTAAAAFFREAPNDGRANVAILLSDGEATDSDPAAVSAQAAALRASGVTMFVMIYGGTLAANAQSDVVEMQRLDAANVKAGNGHWYASSYAAFSAYIDALIGVDGQGGLAASVAANPDHVVELQNADALSKAIASILVTKALKNCTPP